MRYKVYTKTDKSWEAMLYTLKRAKKSIFFEMYIFVDDSIGNSFIDILEEKARSGVKVKIVLDSFGSSLSKETTTRLKEAGAELLYYKVRLRVTHRKMIVVDEELAFIGGININKYFEKWDDLFIRVEGKVVRYIARAFAKMYRDCGGEDQYVLQYLKTKGNAKGRVKYYDNYPPGLSRKLRKYYHKKIKQARVSILLVTPYFMPNFWLRWSLRRAVKRGVEVEIIIPREATHPKISNVSNYFFMEKLRKSGIKFFLTKNMNHAKLMLIDGKEGVLGSQNLDIGSFDMNVESGIFFTEDALVKELVNLTNKWKSDGILYTSKMRVTHSFDHILEVLFNIYEILVRFYNTLTAKIF